MHDFIDPLKRYADFSGRARRREYWMFHLFSFLIAFTLVVAGVLILGIRHPLNAVPMYVFVVATLIPSIALTVRRLHDLNKPTWWVVFALIPLLNIVFMLGFLTRRGTAGPNTFGPDPCIDELHQHLATA